MERAESTRHGIKYSREIVAKFMDCGSAVDSSEAVHAVRRSMKAVCYAIIRMRF